MIFYSTIINDFFQKQMAAVCYLSSYNVYIQNSRLKESVYFTNHILGRVLMGQCADFQSESVAFVKDSGYNGLLVKGFF
jgi:hypothetical protein